MPGGKKKKGCKALVPKIESSRNRNDAGQAAEMNPVRHFLIIGELQFAGKNFIGALESFGIVLDILKRSSTPPDQLRVRVIVLLKRAECFLALSSLSALSMQYHLENSTKERTEAYNLSQEMNFQEGICYAIQLEIVTEEQTGDIGTAFQLAVSLKTIDSKIAKPHVNRLRKKLECDLQKNPALADELRENLMSTGIDNFTKRLFDKAAEYFTEVIRLVCEVNFVRDAYIYQAKCDFELGAYEEAQKNCAKVLERYPDDEEGRNLIESINAILRDQTKGTKKKKSKRSSNSLVPVEQAVPVKKPVLNKKQKQYEDYRRRREAEKIGKEYIENSINKDREKQELKRDEKNAEMDGAKSVSGPSYDVNAAIEASSSRKETSDKQAKVQAVVSSGARPKERKVNETSKSTKRKSSIVKKNPDVSCNKSYSTEVKRSSRGIDVSFKDNLLFSNDPLESELGVSKRNQTAGASTESDDEWTEVKPKSQKRKSEAENTLYRNQHAFRSIGNSQDSFTDCIRSVRNCKEPEGKKHESKPNTRQNSSIGWPSLPGPSLAEKDSSLHASNKSTIKRFSANRDRQDFKSEQNVKDNLQKDFAFIPVADEYNMDNFDSADFDPFLIREEPLRQDFFSTNPESFICRNGKSPELAASKIPALSGQPLSNAFTGKVKMDENAPKSQWETLEKISPLRIPQTLDLVKATRNSTLTANTKSELPPHTDDLSQEGPNSREVLPKGVYPLCEHFLQDNRKGQSFRHPNPCLKCKRHSKILYGIWMASRKEWQVMRPYPKAVNFNVPFQLCWHFKTGVTCQKSPCTFAHGEEELKFWTSKRQSDHVSIGRIAVPKVGGHEKDLDNIPKPQEHIQGTLIIRDISTGKPRPPPAGVYQGNFQLCKWWKSGRVCRFGRYCSFAHGTEELRSWMEYKNETQETKSKEESSSQKPETNAGILRSEMVSVLPGVEVTSNKPVKIFLRDDERRHSLNWVITVTFEISKVGKLCQIDLLHRYHDCYRLTEIKGFHNDIEIFSRVPTERWSYRLPSFFDLKEGRKKVAVSVSFQTTTLNRTFTQCLRFDFGKKPYLIQGLNVDIANEEALNRISATRQKLKLDTSVWTEESVDVVPSPDTAEMSAKDRLLLTEYRLPERIENVVSAQIIDGNMTVDNYKRLMHQLLFTEELFMKKAISSFLLQSVTLYCQQSTFNERAGLTYAENGELFGILNFLENETLRPDEAAGRLLIRNVKSAWLKTAGSSSQKVYEVLVKNVDNESVTLKLSSQMCLDLQLTDSGQIPVDVQFQLNRQPLCEWHTAVDRLGPIQLRFLFPKPNGPQVQLLNQEEGRPWNWLSLDPKVNNNQKEVIRHILAPGKYASPLVVFGPFGTGKTFTLNQAIRHLVTTKHNRILLCTHTNSAADIHVKLLHDYLTKENGLHATTPLRIYQTNRRLNTDSEIARKYGLIKNNAYVLPTRDDVIRHRVVITTLAMSKHLLDLNLNHGFFTHILVDEAAQALEPEALIPLALAGPNTKVVFTGDHMQMSPEVYSNYARDWGLQRSLPERLFDHYYETQSSDCSVMYLTENYRCHSDILQFPSDNFYGKELIARSEHASHPRLGPLLFFSVCGAEEAIDNSYINTAEVEEVVKRVKELANDWPLEWQEKDLSQIGVISAYTSQVRAIRNYLRRESRELHNVTVESIHNVQGKEFRAVFISTVRTSLTCHRFDRHEDDSQPLHWEFLSDPKLLNTAITRAMSLVAVVGDSVSLCTAGDCRGNWRDYIKRCHIHGSLQGTSYDQIKREIDTPLARISLNPEAAVFVPKPTDVTCEEFKLLECATQPGAILGLEENSDFGDDNTDDDGYSKSSVSNTEDMHTIPNDNSLSGSEMDDTKEYLTQSESTSEDDEEEHYSPRNDNRSVKRSSHIVSQHRVQTSIQKEPQRMAELEEGENDAGQNASEGFEELLRESFEDETVFPKYLDKIIKALVEKCKDTKKKETRVYGSSENVEFPSLHTAATTSKKKANESKRVSQEKAGLNDFWSEDYEICVVNGRQEVRVVNLGFHQAPSSRHQRLTSTARQDDYLDSQLLQQLLLDKPNTYLRCTLRLNSEIVRMAYAEVADTKTPDIKIKGRVRGVFDMDHVVVEISDLQPTSGDGYPHCQGKIAGVLNHIISPHERQYVCKVDYENPEVMIPINKSVSKIVNLSDKRLRGFPIYKEIRRGDEKPVKVKLMDIREVLSGKFLFLVQYLQWRPDCYSPLGIVIRKLPQGNTLSDSMKILFAEHGVRENFSKESKIEVQTMFTPEWSIPAEEYKIRQRIDGAFTIDPDNSKDLDDAITLEKLPGPLNRVGVHIADVSYFVEPGTHLDKEAFFRCTSYYPGDGYQSVPMLPRELSENHCSLLPGKDRMCLSVFLDVSEEGKLIGQPEIRRTIIRSCCQLTYSEAQKIIDGQKSSLPQITKDVEDNIRALSVLAQRKRKFRLRNASCDHWSNSDDGEDFEAHELVEEMMILANEEIAKYLSARIPGITPLRTQLPPKDHKLRDWIKEYGQFMKYSLFLQGFYPEEDLKKMMNDSSVSEATQFKVQESVWIELCNAAESEDQAKLQKLICNESNHPQLAVANSQFRRIQPKSLYVCEKDQPAENVVHFSLGMPRYTHFSSPIRRYIDIQVHRLVLELISQERSTNKSSKDQVSKVCRRSTFAQGNSRKFDRACSKVHLAAKLKENSRQTTAIIASIEKEAITLEIPYPDYNHLSKRQRRLKLSNLNPFGINISQGGSEMVINWKLRLYLAPKENIIEEVIEESKKVIDLLSQGLGGKGGVFNLPAEKWLQILNALQQGKFKELEMLIRMTDKDRQLASRLPESSSPKKPCNFSNKEKGEANMEYFYENKLCLRTFDTVKVQMTAHLAHGILHPEIQLFKINSSVHICVEHRKYPRECFATTSRYQASRRKYSSVNKYIDAWEPVLAMEAATGAVEESDEFTIHHLMVQWRKENSENPEGSFSIQMEYCESRQIDFYEGDFVCVRVREDSYNKRTSYETTSCFVSTERSTSEEERNPLNEGDLSSGSIPSSRHESGYESENFWVGHCIIKHVGSNLPTMDTLEIAMDLHQSASVFPEGLLNGESHSSTLTVIHRSLPHRRMFAALCSLPSASQLVHSICLGHEPSQEHLESPPSSNLSIIREHPKCRLKPLNEYQEEAVKEALMKPFTLVLGPPGTGKTVTGVHIAYWFARGNEQSQLQRGQGDGTEKSEVPAQVIYCGPSNKSVDVVARYMLQIPELKIIRVYGDRKEQAEFPIPNKPQPLKSSTDDDDQNSNEDAELKAVSLHHIIRSDRCPFAVELGEYESKFEADRKEGLRTSTKEVKAYRKLIGMAEDWALLSSGAQIILCTCAVAGMPRIADSCRDNIKQCIVDECGMCLEPESLVPISCSGVKQVVLIGDHKQLQPVIQDNLAVSLGLNVSMFERLSERAKMLELQYRMQKEICKFPSSYFYEGRLKTDPSVPTRDPCLPLSFWPAHASRSGRNVPMAFCHVEGEEDSSVIKTAQSNEQSKANEKEVRKVVHVARSLVLRNGVDASRIVILSPYREQRSRISDALKEVFRCKDILVTTIAKSQGSEWDYVILSLVRSLSKSELDPEPSLSWFREHLGFLTDEHQMNVGLTRARKGLCIIGNKNLLMLHPLWQKLIEFYEENNCLVNESDWPTN